MLPSHVKVILERRNQKFHQDRANTLKVDGNCCPKCSAPIFNTPEIKQQFYQQQWAELVCEKCFSTIELTINHRDKGEVYINIINLNEN